MSIVTETGAGLSNGETYASVVAFKAYCDARGVSYAAFTDAQLEQFLRKAADYIGETYRTRWCGYRVTETQALDWPRSLAAKPDQLGSVGIRYYLTTEIPAEVIRAQNEMTIRASAGDDLTADTTQTIKREKVGAIETEYAEHSRAGTAYLAVDRLLALLLSRSGASVMLRRS